MSKPRAWRWYHIVLTTYGAWLDGDSRGFRTRHHREHIEGDYRTPPPSGCYEEREQRSRNSLGQPSVILPEAMRAVIGSALRERLENLGATVICISVAGQHVHLLAKMPLGQARRWSGLAKAHAWHVVRGQGWSKKLWAKRGHEKPITDRRHQLNTFHYILAHADEGAWTWYREHEQGEESY